MESTGQGIRVAKEIGLVKGWELDASGSTSAKGLHASVATDIQRRLHVFSHHPIRPRPVAVGRAPTTSLLDEPVVVVVRLVAEVVLHDLSRPPTRLHGDVLRDEPMPSGELREGPALHGLVHDAVADREASQPDRVRNACRVVVKHRRAPSRHKVAPIRLGRQNDVPVRVLGKKLPPAA
eukprot:CAMPEP_0177498524 /NCGR_PEP_ID=MMETSP0369-20130122/35626_1 /TAXON_ID=447022 ORGANISM="Scrippsiella hangoei-like, Strain SHHI-4" /NCGR_SAMPLE_ID=MMETSP0369 /ASSEMBLY_ACC=CAM_ASM_000364 /LENGTH=178 /DNA_ID=CAMNT_0018975747 /DNA_START=605 /DNA_END=1141 /DNA_ORIENTATION=-